MKPLCWYMLLLRLSVSSAENIEIKQTGESVTFQCSSSGCNSSIEMADGMNLYKRLKVLEEVLFYFQGSPDKITPRLRYENRIQTKGSLMSHTTTISNLTVDDSGIYSCVYKSHDISAKKVVCNVYTLFVRAEVSETPQQKQCDTANDDLPSVHCDHANDKGPSLVLLIIASCISSMLVTIIFFLLIFPRVKQWTCCSRRRRRVSQVSNEYVYEVMTKNGLCPQAALQSPPSLNDSA